MCSRSAPLETSRAFVVGWMDWVSTVATVAAVSIVIGESIAAVWSVAANHAVAVACVVVVLFTTLLLGGSRLGDQAQQLTSAIKAIALVALIAACFLMVPHSGASHLRSDLLGAGSVVTPAAAGFAGFILAAQSVVYSYDGWTGPRCTSARSWTIPRASDSALDVFGGLIAAAALYLLINIAFIHVVPTPRELAGSSMAAATVAQRTSSGRAVS